jgi:hypothetical protein
MFLCLSNHSNDKLRQDTPSLLLSIKCRFQPRVIGILDPHFHSSCGVGYFEVVEGIKCRGEGFL